MLKLFQILTVFNWVTPALGLIQDVLNDPTPLQNNSWTFFFDYDDALFAGWDASDIEKLLATFGVKTWGSQITLNTYFFRVKLEQAQWAEYILASNGIPMQARSLGAPKPKTRRVARW